MYAKRKQPLLSVHGKEQELLYVVCELSVGRLLLQSSRFLLHGLYGLHALLQVRALLLLRGLHEFLQLELLLLLRAGDRLRALLLLYRDQELFRMCGAKAKTISYF